jgi:uncharacterized protein (DUF488 family)
MKTIYTFGYQGMQVEAVRAKAATLGALILDVRMSPSAQDPQWRKAALVQALGAEYRHAQEFGNVNFKGGPILLKDARQGMAKIGPILLERPVLLMCACWNVQVCHRKTVAELIAGEYGCEIVHLTRSDFPKPPKLPPAQTSLFGD